MYTTIKQARWTETESTVYGPYTANYCKTIRHHEIGGIVYQDETTTRNGIIVYSADYPANTEYAKSRIPE